MMPVSAANATQRNRDKILEQQSEYRARVRETRNAQKREHYQRNREQISAQRAEYRKQPKYRAMQAEANRRYREQNPDKIREYEKAYYQANGDVVRERSRQRHRRDPGRAHAQSARWREKNAERLTAQRMFKAHGLWPEDWAAMWEAQGGRCYLGGEELDTSEYHGVVVEHDHSCCPPNRSCRICRRGLACASCNLTIGNAGDDVARLRRIADALEAAQQAVKQRQAAAAVNEQLALPLEASA